jgi:hypothetical protein
MKKKLLITGLFLLGICDLYAQTNFAAVPLRPKSVGGFTTGLGQDDNRGYMCGNTWFFGTKNGLNFQLHSFDGTLYKKYPSFSVDTANLGQVIAFRDTILLVGRFYPKASGGKLYRCMILRGNTWDTFPSAEFGSVFSSAVVDDKLYVLNNNYTVYELAHWGSIKPILQLAGGGSNPTLLARDKEQELLIFGADGDTIYRYRAGNWNLVNHASPNAAYYTALDGDSTVYLYDPLTFKLSRLGMNFTINHLTALSGQSGIEDFKGIAIIGRQLLIGATKVYDIGTGNVTSSAGLSAMNGINYSKGMVYGIDYFPGDNTTRAFEITAGASVSGRMYYDVGLNCVKDVTDPVYKNIAAYVLNSNDTFPFFCDDTGAYSVVVPPGSNAFRFAEKYTFPTGTFCGLRLDTFLTAGKVIAHHLPFYLDSNKRDIGVHLVGHSGFRARQGFEETYSLVIRNHGTTIDTLGISLTYPDSLSFVSASVGPVSHTGRKLVFDAAGIGRKSDRTITLVFKVSVDKKIGSRAIFFVQTDSIDDWDTSNNQYTLVQKVVAAYDPNSKQSNPEGIVYNPVSIIQYQINFQNYGTDTAYRVLVVDSFLPNFPLEKLQMTTASHKYHLTVRPGNVLIWEFDNIKLPPTKENVAKSSGFIAFEAPLRSQTKPGQIVSNRAHIYFDYQKAVITDWNDIIHGKAGIGVKAVDPVKSGIKIYPNPTSGDIRVICVAKIGKGLIMDAAGAVVLQFDVTSNQCDLNLNALAPGMYFLRIPALQQTARLIKN